MARRIGLQREVVVMKAITAPPPHRTHPLLRPGRRQEVAVLCVYMCWGAVGSILLSLNRCCVISLPEGETRMPLTSIFAL